METIRIDVGSDNTDTDDGGCGINGMALEYKTTIFVHTVDFPNDDDDDGIVQ